MFLGETTSLEFLRPSALSFLSGVIYFLLACRILKFARPASKPGQK